MSPQKMLRGLEQFIAQNIRSISPHQYHVNQEGRLVVTVDEFQIGSIFDTDAFKESLSLFPNWLSDSQYDIALKFEESTQQDIRHAGPRRYSGLYPYSHIERDVLEALRLSKLANVPLDFEILIAIIGHDRIEDDGEVRSLSKQWREAAVSGRHSEREDLAEQLVKVRMGKKDKIVEELMSFRYKTSANERRALESQINGSGRLIYGVTIFSDREPYAFSVGSQYTQLMIGPNVKEDLMGTLRRIIVKSPDKNSNMRERGGLARPSTQRGIHRVFNESGEVGEELRRRYGTVRHYAADMPGAEQVKMAYDTIYPLHYGNVTFNALNPMLLGIDPPKTARLSRAKDLLALAKVSHREMGLTLLELIDSAAAFYERKYDDVRAMKDQVTKEIEMKRHGRWYEGITLDGFTKDWLLRDPWSREDLRALDNDAYLRAENYRAIRHLRQVVENLLKHHDPNERYPNGRAILLDDPQTYDPKIHRLFTLSGIDHLKALTPDYWELVAESKAKFDRIRSSGARGFTSYL